MELFIILIIAACAFVWGLINFFIGKDINAKLHEAMKLAREQQKIIEKKTAEFRAINVKWAEAADNCARYAKKYHDVDALNYGLTNQVADLDERLKEAEEIITAASIDLKGIKLKSKNLDKVIADLDGYNLAVEKAKSDSEETI